MIFRQSQLFVRVLRQTPSGLDRITGAAVRGGYIRVGRGGLVWLPLGARVRDRIRERIRSALGAEDAPVIEESAAGSTLSILAGELRSFRDLPVRLGVRRSRPPSGRFLANPFFAEDGGLCAAEDSVAARLALAPLEASMKDATRRLGLRPVRALAGPDSEVWFEAVAGGAARVLRCPSCGYAAEAEWAEFRRGNLGGQTRSLELVETPGATTIPRLTDQLQVGAVDTIKAMLFTADDGEMILVLLRGDLDLSPSKLRERLGGGDLRPATPEEVLSKGMVPGYAGPIGLPVRRPGTREGVRVLADDSISAGVGRVGGANREGFHYLGATLGRDFEVTEQGDLALATAGAACATCGEELEMVAGLVVARRHVVADGFAFSNRSGGQTAGALGVLEADTVAVFGAALNAALVEDGITWPAACAPFDVHAIELPGGADLDGVLRDLAALGLDVLKDDRDTSAGVKFAEADWIGCPVRLLAGRKSAEQGGVEIRAGRGPGEIFRLGEVVERVQFYLRGSTPPDGEVM